MGCGIIHDTTEKIDFSTKSDTFRQCYQSLSNFDSIQDKERCTLSENFIKLVDENIEEAKTLYIHFIHLFESISSLGKCKNEFEDAYKGDLKEVKIIKILPRKVIVFETAIRSFDSLPDINQKECVRGFNEICEMSPKEAYRLYDKYDEIIDGNQALKVIKELNWNEMKKHIPQFAPKSGYKLIEEVNNISVYHKASDSFVGSDKKQIRNLLVVGETGSGKTTLLNSLTTYLLGIKMADTFRIKSIVEKTGLSQSHSQTSEVTEYVLKPSPKKFPYRIRFIDTPGFGDTRGLQYDQYNVNLIRSYLKKCKHDLHGICFVIKASTNRMTSIQSYITHQILSLFGKDIVDNFFAMITFADNEIPLAIAAMKEAGIPIKQSFKFNNSAFFPTKNKEEDPKLNALAWEMGTISYKQFFNVLQGITPVTMDMTQLSILTKEYLEASARIIQEKINEGIMEKKNLQEQFDVFSKNYDSIANNTNFKYDEYYEELVEHKKPPGSFTTNCIKCQTTCHETCKYKDNADKANCLMMKDGNCTVCPGKCHWSNHHNLGYYHEKIKKKRTVTGAEAKVKFFNGVYTVYNVEMILKQIEQKIKEATTAIISNVKEIREIMEKMTQYSMRTLQTDVSEYLNLMIKEEEKDKRDGFQERIKQIEAIRDQNKALINLDNLKEVFNPAEIETMMGDVKSKGSNVDRIMQNLNN